MRKYSVTQLVTSLSDFTKYLKVPSPRYLYTKRNKIAIF